ncbi:embryonal Fyn-associated substrate-like [Mustelus asterias]
MPTGQQEIYKVPRSLTQEGGGAVETYDVPTGLRRNVSPGDARVPPLTVDVYDSPRESPGTISTQPLSERLAGLRLSVTEGISRLMEAVSRGLGGRHLSEAGSSGVSEASGALGRSLAQLVTACRASQPCCPALETHLRGLEEAQALLGELGRRLEAWQRRPEAGGGGGRSLSGLQDLSQFAGVAGRISHHLEASACLLAPAAQAQAQAQARPRGPPVPGVSQPTFRRPLPPVPEPGCKAGIQTRPLPPTPAYAPEEKPAEDANVYEGVGPCGDEHEYVHLQGKDSAEGSQTEALRAKETVKTVDQSVEMQDSECDSLSAADRPLVAFYAQQCNGHLSTLLGAIEGLFSCLRSSQPPRIFVGHGRHVVVSAHKLVFIGDALSRQARGAGVRSRVGRAGALLCQALKETVQATKRAAQRYPELPAVQDMVDKVTELSQHALRFTQLLGELTA